jgi:hypothetical protein
MWLSEQGIERWLVRRAAWGSLLLPPVGRPKVPLQFAPYPHS